MDALQKRTCIQVMARIMAVTVALTVFASALGTSGGVALAAGTVDVATYGEFTTALTEGADVINVTGDGFALEADVTITRTVTITSEVGATITTGGNSIYVGDRWQLPPAIGHLSITGDLVIFDDNPESYAGVIQISSDESSLTLDDNATIRGRGCAINTMGAAVITIDGGEVEAAGYTSGDDFTSGVAISTGGGTVVINDGTISGEGGSGEGGIGLASYDTTVTVNGGSISASGYDCSAVSVGSGSEFILNSGTIEAEGEESSGIYLSGTAEIMGGTITASGAHGVGIETEDTAQLTISGGTITASGVESAGVQASGTVSISGGGIVATGDASFGVFARGTTTIIGGEISAEDDGGNPGVAIGVLANNPASSVDMTASDTLSINGAVACIYFGEEGLMGVAFLNSLPMSPGVTIGDRGTVVLAGAEPEIDFTVVEGTGGTDGALGASLDLDKDVVTLSPPAGATPGDYNLVLTGTFEIVYDPEHTESAVLNLTIPVTLLPEFAGGDGYEEGTGAGPYQIANAAHLNNVRNHLDANFVLMNDIDLTDYLSESGTGWNEGKGWLPIGTDGNLFTGIFDGNGNTISGLYINNSDLGEYVGLFGCAGDHSIIKDLILSDVNVIGQYYTGGLVGATAASAYINNCHVDGEVYGECYVGGLVGEVGGYPGVNGSSSSATVEGSGDYIGGLVGWTSYQISNSYATGAVTGISSVGGLAGHQSERNIIACYAVGSVTGLSEVGGLVGKQEDDGTIDTCYASGDVTATSASFSNAGGLVGDSNGAINRSWSLGNVYGAYNLGGLVGNIDFYGSVSDSYATGQLTANGNAGGLAGYTYSGSTITRCYAVGSVSGSQNTGGLIGYNGGSSITASHYNTQTSGMSDTGKGEPNSSADMAQAGTFAGWDFTAITGTWTIDEGISYPYLQANEQTPPPAPPAATGITITPEAVTKTYGEASFTLECAFTGPAGAYAMVTWTSDDTSVATVNDAGFVTIVGYGTDGTATITASINGGAFTDTSAVTVEKKALTVDDSTSSLTVQNKPYDGTTDAAVTSPTIVFVGVIPEDTVTVSSVTAMFEDKNAGDSKDVYLVSVVLGGADGGNYVVTGLADLDPLGGANIVAREITVTAHATTKTYGDDDPAFTYAVGGAGLVGDESLTGTLSRDPGEDVIAGGYAIVQGTLTDGADGNNPNYVIAYTGASFVITARPITIAANALSKHYGDADPELTYVITPSDALVGDDTLSGTLNRAPGETLGTYAITQGSLAASDNYALTYNSANFTIDKRPITIAADAKSKTTGAPDPALTYRITAGSLLEGDQLAATLQRAVGETVGNYEITLLSHDITNGVDSVLSNYEVTYTGAGFTIRAPYVPPDTTSPSSTVEAGGKIAASPTVNATTGVASSNVSSAALEMALSRAETNADGTKSVEIVVPPRSQATGYETILPADALSSSARTRVSVNTEVATVTMPGDMIPEDDLGGATHVSLTIGHADISGLDEETKNLIGDRPVIRLSLELDGESYSWSNEDAPVTVVVPYTPTAEELQNPDGIVVWYIDGSGNLVSVPNGRYDHATGTVVFGVTHFSDYAVGYNDVVFVDVPAGEWYSQAVGFIAAREITGGTGDGMYSPGANLKRGDFLVLVMRAHGIAPDTDANDNFADAGDTYYTGYLAAAKRLGISNGVGENMFAPDRDITRQEMFTLLYNALKVIGQLPQGESGKTLAQFTDAGQVESWAVEAMTCLVKTGIVGGSDGKILPADTTTRAEMAQVLYNLLTR